MARPLWREPSVRRNVPLGSERSEVLARRRWPGFPINILKASTSREIESAFATIVREQIEALFISGDAFLTGRSVQIATLATRHGIATSSAVREFAEAGGLMSYGTSNLAMWHQVGLCTGQILKGARPADLPVVQSTRLEFIINMQTARAIGIEVPPTVLPRADEVIE